MLYGKLIHNIKAIAICYTLSVDVYKNTKTVTPKTGVTVFVFLSLLILLKLKNIFFNIQNLICSNIYS